MSEEEGPLGDVEVAKRSRKSEVRERAQARRDLAAVMATVEGRRFVWRLISKANVFGDEYAADARDHARSSGYRAFGVDLLDEIQRAATADYVRMLNEQFALSAAVKAKRVKDE